MAAAPPAIIVSATELRQRFNTSDLPDRIARGTVQVRVLKEATANPARHGLGVVSRLIDVRDPASGARLALAHQYVRDGRPITPLDPKWLHLGDAIYTTR